MNNFLQIAGPVFICGAFFLIALDEKKRKEKAWDRVIDLKVEKQGLEEIIREDNKVMSKRMEQIGDLQEDVRKGADRFSKDQVTIADLNHQLCEKNMENFNLSNELELMVKRGNVKMDRARKLGGVENV